MRLAVWSLARRDVVRFLRQRSRIVGALGSPVLFWFVIGSGLGRSFQGGPGGVGYLEYFFPGSLALIVLFTAIFAEISVIEDRHAGFLQGVLVAPVPRTAIVLGKVLGGAALAVLQACLFLVAAPFAGIHLTLAALGSTVLTLAVLAVGLTGLGFLVAWPLASTQGFHAIMNMFLVPMWLLSGALFPASGASPWVALLMRINPLSYGVEALRLALYARPGLAVPLGVTALFSLVMILAGTLAVRRPLKG